MWNHTFKYFQIMTHFALNTRIMSIHTNACIQQTLIYFYYFLFVHLSLTKWDPFKILNHVESSFYCIESTFEIGISNFYITTYFFVWNRLGSEHTSNALYVRSGGGGFGKVHSPSLTMPCPARTKVLCYGQFLVLFYKFKVRYIFFSLDAWLA